LTPGEFPLPDIRARQQFITHKLHHPVNILEPIFLDHIGIQIITQMPIINRQPLQIQPNAFKPLGIRLGVKVLIKFVPEIIIFILTDQFEHRGSERLFVSRVAIGKVLVMGQGGIGTMFIMKRQKTKQSSPLEEGRHRDTPEYQGEGFMVSDPWQCCKGHAVETYSTQDDFLAFTVDDLVTRAFEYADHV
jgi:hypothetical protein